MMFSKEQERKFSGKDQLQMKANSIADFEGSEQSSGNPKNYSYSKMTDSSKEALEFYDQAKEGTDGLTKRSYEDFIPLFKDEVEEDTEDNEQKVWQGIVNSPNSATHSSEYTASDGHSSSSMTSKTNTLTGDKEPDEQMQLKQASIKVEEKEDGELDESELSKYELVLTDFAGDESNGSNDFSALQNTAHNQQMIGAYDGGSRTGTSLSVAFPDSEVPQNDMVATTKEGQEVEKPVKEKRKKIVFGLHSDEPAELSVKKTSFQCTDCRFSCSTASTLAAHMRQHPHPEHTRIAVSPVMMAVEQQQNPLPSLRFGKVLKITTDGQNRPGRIVSCIDQAPMNMLESEHIGDYYDEDDEDYAEDKLGFINRKINSYNNGNKMQNYGKQNLSQRIGYNNMSQQKFTSGQRGYGWENNYQNQRFMNASFPGNFMPRPNYNMQGQQNFKRSFNYRHSATINEPASIPCPICGEEFTKRDSLNLHIQMKHTVKKFFCLIGCSRWFSSVEQQIKHERSGECLKKMKNIGGTGDENKDVFMPMDQHFMIPSSSSSSNFNQSLNLSRPSVNARSQPYPSARFQPYPSNNKLRYPQQPSPRFGQSFSGGKMRWNNGNNFARGSGQVRLQHQNPYQQRQQYQKPQNYGKFDPSRRTLSR